MLSDDGVWKLVGGEVVRAVAVVLVEMEGRAGLVRSEVVPWRGARL